MHPRFSHPTLRLLLAAALLSIGIACSSDDGTTGGDVDGLPPLDLPADDPSELGADPAYEPTYEPPTEGLEDGTGTLERGDLGEGEVSEEDWQDEAATANGSSRERARAESSAGGSDDDG